MFSVGQSCIHPCTQETNKRSLEARDLRPGDVLLRKDGGVVHLERIAARQDQQSVFHLMIDGFHTYAVQDKGILVHNGGMKEPKEAPPSLEAQKPPAEGGPEARRMGMSKWDPDAVYL